MMKTEKWNKKLLIGVLTVLVCIFLGCTKKDALILTEEYGQEEAAAGDAKGLIGENAAEDQLKSNTMTDVGMAETGQINADDVSGKTEADQVKSGNMSNADKAKTSTGAEAEKLSDAELLSGAGILAEAEPLSGVALLSEESAKQAEAEEKLLVHICGAVNKPGVYEFKKGDRICQAIEMAGGFAEDAAEDFLNQAQRLEDGMKLCIPTTEEAKEALEEEDAREFLSYAEENSVGEQGQVLEAAEGDSLININTATEELLCTLPGIGSSKAKSIIAYRTEKGSFQTIEDIMKVEGIKEGMFAKIKDKISVRG